MHEDPSSFNQTMFGALENQIHRREAVFLFFKSRGTDRCAAALFFLILIIIYVSSDGHVPGAFKMLRSVRFLFDES